MTRHAITLIVALLLPVGVVTGQGASPACVVSNEPPGRVALPDGRTVSVDVQSLAASGDTVMAVGRHAYVFPREATPLGPFDLHDSFIGFLTDARRNTSLVPTPFPDRTVRYPKVAASNGEFHVLFATGDDSLGTQPGPQDSATIWYARFRNAKWTTPERVIAVTNARLHAEITSELLVHNGELSFLFAFEDTWTRNGAGGGLILLRRRDGTWIADTLHLRSAPGEVHAAHESSGGALVVLFAQSMDTPQPQLHLTRFTSTWSPPRLFAGDGTRMATYPILAFTRDEMIASWSSWRPWDTQTAEIEWVRGTRDGREVKGPVVEVGAMAFPFEMVMLANRPLWLFHGNLGGTSLAIATVDSSSLTRLRDIAVPFENPRTHAIPLSGSRLMAFTMKQGKEPNEPMVASYATVIEIRCPNPAPR